MTIIYYEGSNGTAKVGHKLLSEYFQSCERKQRHDKVTDELLCSNLPSRFSKQARDKNNGNPPNTMVIRQISW